MTCIRDDVIVFIYLHIHLFIDLFILQNGIEKLWLLVQDLLSLTGPPEHRHTTLQMLTTLTAAQDRLGAMRHVFYNYVAENYQHEDIKPM